MNVELDIMEFVTDKHRKAIEDKITKAINAIDQNQLSGIINESVVESLQSDVLYEIIEEVMCGHKIREILTKKLVKVLK